MVNLSILILLAAIMVVVPGAEATEPFRTESLLMKYEEVHVGGKEVGQNAGLSLFVKGNHAKAMSHLHDAQWMLGELKRKAELMPDGDMRYQLYSEPKKFDDCTVIRVMTIQTDPGQPDIDMIYMEAYDGTKSELPTVTAFTLYYKVHTMVSEWYTPTWSIEYFISEPYNTSGGALRAQTDEANDYADSWALSDYTYDADYSDTSAYDGSYEASPDIDADSYDGLAGMLDYTETIISDSFATVGSIGYTNYGMYSINNTDFEPVDEGYGVSDGYIGKFAISTTTDVQRDAEMNLVQFNEQQSRGGWWFDYTVVDGLDYTKASEFLPGYYVAGAANYDWGYQTGGSSSYPDYDDFGGYTLVVELSDGTSQTYEFDWTIDTKLVTDTIGNKRFFPANVLAINPIDGIIKELEYTDPAENPFVTKWDSSQGGSANTLYNKHYQVTRDIASESAIRTIDIFEDYRSETTDECS